MNASVERQVLDIALQKSWKLAAKKILEKICRHKIEHLHVGYGLKPWTEPFIGDADHIFTCNIAFSFGESNCIPLDSFKHSITPRHSMVDVNELTEHESRSAMHALFYSHQPIAFIKNRYGIVGDIFEWHSILDAVEAFGLCTEEILIQSDLDA